MTFTPVLSTEAQHRFAKIHDAIVGGRSGANQVDFSKFGIFLKQHCNCAGTLGRFAAAAASVFRDVSANNNRLATGTIQGQVAQRTLHAIHTAEASMLEFRHFAASGYRCLSLGHQGAIDHAFDNNRAGRIIRTGFRSEAKKFDPRRINVVLVNKAHNGGCRHRINALVRTPQPKTAPNNFACFRPLIARPLAPILEPYPKRWYVGS